MSRTTRAKLPDKQLFVMPVNIGTARGVGWLVGSPPCVVVHGRAIKGVRNSTRSAWQAIRDINATTTTLDWRPIRVDFSLRGPWVMSTLHTGLSIEHSLFCFRDPRAAIQVAEYIATIAPLLDVPLYSKETAAVHEAVRATDGAFMQAIRDYLTQLAPELRIEEGVRLYGESTGWRKEFIKLVRREL